MEKRKFYANSLEFWTATFELLENNVLAAKSLFKAVKAGDLTKVEHALSSGTNPNVMTIEKTSGDEWSPLFYAARIDHSDIARMLIESGADVNKLNPNDKTPLLIVAQLGAINVAKVLLEYGANPNYDASNNQSPLYHALLAKNFEFVELLLDYGAKPNSKGWGAKEAAQIILEYLAQSGIDVQPEKHGSGSLAKESSSQLRALLNLLISWGAQVNEAGDFSRLAAQSAQQDKLKVLRLLLEHNARFEMPAPNVASVIDSLFNKQDSSPAKKLKNALVISAGRGKLNFVTELLEDHRDVLTDVALYKALERAIACGHVDIFKVLLKAVNQIECQNQDACDKIFLLAATVPLATREMLELLYTSFTPSAEILSIALVRASVHRFKDRIDFILQKDFEQNLHIDLSQAGRRIIELLRNRSLKDEKYAYELILATIVGYQRARELKTVMQPNGREEDAQVPIQDLPAEIRRHILRVACPLFANQSAYDRKFIKAADEGVFVTVQAMLKNNKIRNDAIERALFKAVLGKHTNVVKLLLRLDFEAAYGLDILKVVDGIAVKLKDRSLTESGKADYQDILNILETYRALTENRKNFSETAYDLSSVPAEINLQLNRFIMGGSHLLEEGFSNKTYPK